MKQECPHCRIKYDVRSGRIIPHDLTKTSACIGGGMKVSQAKAVLDSQKKK